MARRQQLQKQQQLIANGITIVQPNDAASNEYFVDQNGYYQIKKSSNGHAHYLESPPPSSSAAAAAASLSNSLFFASDSAKQDMPLNSAYEEYSKELSSQQSSILEGGVATSFDSMEGTQDRVTVSREEPPSLDGSKVLMSRDFPYNNGATTTTTATITPVTTSEESWAKRSARSIDEGIRFKSSLREGLEQQTKAHRERLLSDLLEGALVGGRGALGTLDIKSGDTVGVGGGIEVEEGGGRNETSAEKKGWFGWLRGGGSNGKNDATVDGSAKNGSFIERRTSTANKEEPNREKETSEPTSNNRSKFGERTITGLITALTEEAENLQVEVDSDPNSPMWNKTIHSIKIYFTRLGCQQLRMGGLNEVFSELESNLAPSEKFSLASSLFNFNKPTSASEAFDRIDVDKSGALDEEELAQALKMAAILGGNKFGVRSKEMLSEMASRLVRLYDTNGDGVVDREEYQVMVKDMATLRDARLREELNPPPSSSGSGVAGDTREEKSKKGPFSFLRGKDDNNSLERSDSVLADQMGKDVIDVTEDEAFWGSVNQGEGSIVFEDLRLDLRRLLFGAIPLAKRVLPGGPLVLKPFTATLTTAFTREDIMDSFLLDAGLRRLVARALCRRVRSIRDLFDGAVFYGRTWKLFEQTSPLVEVPKLQDIQFDSRNRLVITGRAKIKASPDSPSIENGFRLRTKIGTRANGRIIGLLQPEIAIFAECPKEIEKKVRSSVKEWFDYTIPTFQPLYAYIPLVSPLKKDDKMDGFNLGEDNQINSIEVKNGKLCFEMSSFLRPGRFLGNHYLAFTVPNRTLILTLDRVREGMRVGRRNKLAAERAAREVKKLAAIEGSGAFDDEISQSTTGKAFISKEGRERVKLLEKELKATIREELLQKEIEAISAPKPKSFITKFVEGYQGTISTELDLETNARLSSSISDFFGGLDSSIADEIKSSYDKR
ncbi:predicted protein [Thalassiosira pseudonana CCMP1335]|uniref:EF-hand domain-containing protein n=1 Tax=Thalassiosira pseudonana TaxID=35128 RepID=B8CAN9_THAPS|nr:predicted protein [Thalassiosira pseudonana CCMP1335]EED89538.1 predicted protein [Thalassiosira pseudonana CCMP1335]